MKPEEEGFIDMYVRETKELNEKIDKLEERLYDIETSKVTLNGEMIPFKEFIKIQKE